MAIFASTTTPGYGDAGRALTIKALEKRYADMMAQQSQQTMPDSIPTPIQGVGHVVNQLAEGMRVAQLQSQAAASRDALAKIQAGINPATGATPQQIADANRYDPDYGRMLTEQGFQRQQKATDIAAREAADKADREFRAQQHKETIDTQKQLAGQTDTRIRELQSQQEASAAAAAEAEREYKRQDARRKEIFDFEFQRREIESKNKPNMNDAEKRLGIERDYAQASQALGRMGEAQELLKQGIDWGYLANVRSGLATSTGGYTGDPELAQRTIRFNSLMSDAAITQMAARLKGQTTNFEMQKFIDIVNNPGAKPEERLKAVNSIVTGLNTEKAITGNVIRLYGGNLDNIDKALATGSGAPGQAVPANVAPPAAGGSGPPPAPTAAAPAPGGGGRPEGKDDAALLQEARDFIAANPGKADAVRQRLQQWGVKGGL